MQNAASGAGGGGGVGMALMHTYAVKYNLFKCFYNVFKIWTL
jgi:hypothetical protein